MKSIFGLAAFAIITSCFSSTMEFPNAFSWAPEIPGKLLAASNFLEKDVFVTESLLKPNEVVIAFQNNAGVSRKATHPELKEGNNFSGTLNFRLLDHLNNLADSDFQLRDTLEHLTIEKEYIITGYKAGGTIAALAARLIFDLLVESGETPESIKKKNCVKLVAFYPYPVGDRLFCGSLADNLGTRNCLYFTKPRLFDDGFFCSPSIAFPGAQINIVHSEYYRDNKTSFACGILFFASVPPTFYCGLEKSLWALLPGSSALISSVLSYFSSDNLSVTSVEVAYAYARESLQMYRDISIGEAGKVPFISVRRGVGQWLYRKIT